MAIRPVKSPISSTGASAPYIVGVKKIRRKGIRKFRKEYVHNLRIRGRSAPYNKNEQAFIERFNRSLREECLGKVKYRIEQLREVRERADDFVRYYHYHRPHLSLSFATPISFLQYRPCHFH